MHPNFQKAIKWSGKLTLYGLALIGLFVLLYHGLGFRTDTDTHQMSLSNQSDALLTDIKILVGHKSYDVNDLPASGVFYYTATVDTEGEIGVSAQLNGKEIRCSAGYVTSSTYDFDLNNSHAAFWVKPDGEIHYSFGTFLTMSGPQPCGVSAP